MKINYAKNVKQKARQKRGFKVIDLETVLTGIFNATMIGIGVSIGNYVATKHIIDVIEKLKKKKKEKNVRKRRKSRSKTETSI